MGGLSKNVIIMWVRRKQSGTAAEQKEMAYGKAQKICIRYCLFYRSHNYHISARTIPKFSHLHQKYKQFQQLIRKQNNITPNTKNEGISCTILSKLIPSNQP